MKAMDKCDFIRLLNATSSCIGIALGLGIYKKNSWASEPWVTTVSRVAEEIENALVHGLHYSGSS